LDIESAEVIPGAASALYGPVAFNGLLSIKTKDAFKYQGLAVAGKNRHKPCWRKLCRYQKALYDFALRFAKAFNDKFCL
jgi:iron complex outermembrane receptor protein